MHIKLIKLRIITNMLCSLNKIIVNSPLQQCFITNIKYPKLLLIKNMQVSVSGNKKLVYCPDSMYNSIQNNEYRSFCLPSVYLLLSDRLKKNIGSISSAGNSKKNKNDKNSNSYLFYVIQDLYYSCFLILKELMNEGVVSIHVLNNKDKIDYEGFEYKSDNCFGLKFMNNMIENSNNTVNTDDCSDRGSNKGNLNLNFNKDNCFSICSEIDNYFNDEYSSKTISLKKSKNISKKDKAINNLNTNTTNSKETNSSSNNDIINETVSHYNNIEKLLIDKNLVRDKAFFIKIIDNANNKELLDGYIETAMDINNNSLFFNHSFNNNHDLSSERTDLYYKRLYFIKQLAVLYSHSIKLDMIINNTIKETI